MAQRPQFFGLSLLVGMSVACSGSTNPAPTIAGTWHVTVLSLDSGSLAPSTFDVAITPVSESTFAVAMPPIVWSVRAERYDTLARLTYFQGDSPDSTLSFEEWCRSLTCALTFHAMMNQARDTLTSEGLLFFDTITVYGTRYVQTIPWAGGRFVAYK